MSAKSKMAEALIGPHFTVWKSIYERLQRGQKEKPKNKAKRIMREAEEALNSDTHLFFSYRLESLFY